MAAPKVVPYPHIVRNPDVLAGEPTIAGTRIAVRHIIETARYAPTVEEILEGYPHLTRDEIEEAFAYYRGHRAEIDRDIAENEAAISQCARAEFGWQSNLVRTTARGRLTQRLRSVATEG